MFAKLRDERRNGFVGPAFIYKRKCAGFGRLYVLTSVHACGSSPRSPSEVGWAAILCQMALRRRSVAGLVMSAAALVPEHADSSPVLERGSSPNASRASGLVFT